MRKKEDHSQHETKEVEFVYPSKSGYLSSSQGSTASSCSSGYESGNPGSDSEESSSGVRGPLTCKVCWDQDIGCIFRPCNHIATCLQCGPAMTDCPICREKITEVEKVFF